jgi:hypothetical protein
MKNNINNKYTNNYMWGNGQGCSWSLQEDRNETLLYMSEPSSVRAVDFWKTKQDC